MILECDNCGLADQYLFEVCGICYEETCKQKHVKKVLICEACNTVDEDESET
jgi:hypothetical protein